MLALLLAACGTPESTEVAITIPPVSLLPVPQHMEMKGCHFELNAETTISYAPEMEGPAQYMAEIIERATGYQLSPQPIEATATENAIVLSKGATKNNEAYVLSVDEHRVTIDAYHEQGAYRGIQTFFQLLPPAIYSTGQNNVQWVAQGITVTDEPRFKWRGLLLDCCRHFMEKDFVKRYIDLLAFHKMNTLHWHLTEDQGWRIEIKKYPKLTEIGAWRTLNDGTNYGGFYTQEDVKEVVAYAKSRGINVVPEIELPGHSQAAVASYPHLSCTGGPFEVETEWGVFKDIYCAGNDSTFIFLEDVLTEVIDLFPGDYIHIGGDEAPKYRWENCSKCQRRIKEEGLKDEHELQSYFIGRIATFLESKGKKLIGWDEIIEGGLVEGATVQSWRGMEGAIEAVQHGNNTIVSPTSHAYFDYDLKSIDMAKVYTFEPVPEGVNEAEAARVLGGECNMWSERAPQETVDSKVFPRILAMSEVLWSNESKRNYTNFHERVQYHYQRLEAMGVDYGFETTPVTFEPTFNNQSLVIDIQKGMSNLELHYTLDGSAPTTSAKKYETPITLSGSGTLKVQAFKDGNPIGPVFEQTYALHYANGIIPELTHPYSEYYKAGGDGGLTNGVRGSTDFRDGQWQGYWGTNLEATIDLGEAKPISTLTTGFLQYNNAWIFLPEWVKYEYSDDGVNFTEYATVKNSVSPKEKGQFIHEFFADFEKPIVARYVRVTAKNMGKCPDWHDASGSDAWLFVDEIVIGR